MDKSFATGQWLDWLTRVRLLTITLILTVGVVWPQYVPGYSTNRFFLPLIIFWITLGILHLILLRWLPQALWKPPQENEMEDPESDPEDDQWQKKTIGAVARNVLRPNHSNGQDERNRQQTNTRQPIQPLPRCEALIHCTPAPLS